LVKRINSIAACLFGQLGKTFPKQLLDKRARLQAVFDFIEQLDCVHINTRMLKSGATPVVAKRSRINQSS
jgi:hypothetical protein